MVGLVDDSEKIKNLCMNFDDIVSDLLQLDEKTYTDKINNYKLDNTSFINN